MAEVIAALGVIASVAQLADYGFKLSIKLYSFGETIYTADKSIKSISNDVSLTSAVLKELCQVIELDESRVVSDNAILATKETVDECLKIFTDLDDALTKSLSNMGKLDKSDGEKQSKVNKGAAAFERLKWPFKQSKMELLRSNLDRLKASLTLMLQVLSYARDVANRKETEASMQYQKQMIESLARSERTMKRRYDALQNALEGQSSVGDFNPTINTAVHVAARDINEEAEQNPPASESPSLPESHYSLGEILLCFRLLHEFLDPKMHSRVSKSPVGIDKIVERALKSIEDVEFKQILHHFEDQSVEYKKQAEREMMSRVRQILRDEYQNHKMKDNYVPTSRSDTISSGHIIQNSDGADVTRASKSTVLDRRQPERHPLAKPQYPARAKYSRETMNQDDDYDHLQSSAIAPGMYDSTWTKIRRGISQNISHIGTIAYPSMKGSSGSRYETGRMFSTGAQKVDDKEQNDNTAFLDEISSISEEDDDTKNIVDALLSEWTTLPGRSQVDST